MTQLRFDWPPRISLTADDYFLSPANRDAFDNLMAPQSWPSGKMVLVGPKASGKSHLARVFAARLHALIIDAREAHRDHPLPEAGRAIVVEQADQMPPEAEEWFFHLHNASIDRAPLLLTARVPPARWPITLPDLASRMQACAISAIGPPDDELLGALITKLFLDRQIAPDPDLPPYLVSRLERSFAAVTHAVERLDALSMTLGRPVSRKLASDWVNGHL